MKEYITLNEKGFAEKGGFVKCYCTDPSGEYIGTIDEYIPATAGLPAGSYIDEPPKIKKGMAIVRTNEGWKLIEDHRKSSVYSTDNGAEHIVDYLGPVHEGYVLYPPSTPYDRWDGKAWVTDEDAQKAGLIEAAEQHRQALIARANLITADWRAELSLDVIEEADRVKLTAWMKYIKAVKAVDTSTAPDINWPALPAE